MESRALVLAVCLSIPRGNQGRIVPGQLRGLAGEGPGGPMETGVDEGTPGRERRDGREQGKGMTLVALQGGRCMFTRRAHSFIVRMAGRCAAITGQRGQMAQAPLIVAAAHENKCSVPARCFMNQSKVE